MKDPNSKYRISASKLKDFLVHEYLYKLKYIDNIQIDEEEKRYNTTGIAFHYLMEKGEKEFLSKYHIADSYLKDELKKLILEKDDSDAMQKRCNSSKTTLELLREKRYDIQEGIGYYQNEQKKIRLTYKEGMQIMNAYQFAKSQPLWDMGSKYFFEEKYSFQYKDFDFVIKPDRYKIEYKNQIYSIKEYQDLLSSNNIGLTYDELQQRKDFSQGATCIIRDFKTSSNIIQMKSELYYGDKFGYLVSMSFYYAIIHMMTGIDDIVVLLDVSELTTSAGEVLNLPVEELRNKFKWVWYHILKLMDKVNNNDREIPPHSLVLGNKKLKEYIKYIPCEQDSFTYLQINDEII